MLWEHNSTIVVMLTKLREMGRVSILAGIVYRVGEISLLSVVVKWWAGLSSIF
jgi:hypothetical protein